MTDISINDLPSDRYFNREISWLLFNKRVLEEAENKNHPLYERLRFLSISASNLDEFYSVRVAGMMGLIRENVAKIFVTGETASQQLKLIYHVTTELMTHQQKVWDDLSKELAENNIFTVLAEDLTKEERHFTDSLFYDHIFPLLTPLAIDPAHPFPFIPHQGIALIVSLRHDTLREEDIKIIIPIPVSLKRFYRLPKSKILHQNTQDVIRFIRIETLILMNLGKLFPEYEMMASGVFKILRDTDLAIEDEAEDLVREFESALRRRRRGEVIRLKISSDTPDDLKILVFDEYELPRNCIIEVGGMVGLSALVEMIASDRADLLFKPFTPRTPERIREYGGDIFKAVAAKDFILHHPYEAFDTVVQFIHQAAHDPDVVAIKFMLYRTSNDSSIVGALIEASENGKSVTAIIELKARFDEAANIRQARVLEKAGVQVVFGFMEWKTHAKVAIIIRREGEKLRTYTHFGTGNYHPVTAKIYTDISLFTADEALGRDAIRLFNFITGYIEPNDMELLSIAPINLKSNILSYIECETQNALAGLPSGIYAKMNALVDGDIIDALYRASQAGVKIMLNIRGVCCLKPHIKGLSENITVRSIVGRYLEHARIISFANGEIYPSPQTKVFISSADWMPRNLSRRIETLVPILNETVKEHIIEQILTTCFADNQQSWELKEDGHYERIVQSVYEEPLSAHQFFMDNPGLSGRGRGMGKKPV